MGAAVSRQVATSVTQAMTNITSSTSVSSQSSCSAQAFSSQNVTIVSIDNSNIGSITLDAKSQISSSCLQSNSTSATFSATLANNLQNTVTQSVKQNGLTLGANVSDSELTQINQTITNFSQSFNVSNLSSCIASIVNEQNLNIGQVSGSTIGNITLAIDQSVISKCVQENEDFSSMASDVSNTLSNVAQQSVSQGMDLFSGLIVIVVILVIAFVVFKGGFSALTNPKLIVPIVIVVGALIGIQILK